MYQATNLNLLAYSGVNTINVDIGVPNLSEIREPKDFVGGFSHIAFAGIPREISAAEVSVTVINTLKNWVDTGKRAEDRTPFFNTIEEVPRWEEDKAYYILE